MLGYGIENGSLYLIVHGDMEGVVIYNRKVPSGVLALPPTMLVQELGRWHQMGVWLVADESWVGGSRLERGRGRGYTFIIILSWIYLQQKRCINLSQAVWADWS